MHKLRVGLGGDLCPHHAPLLIGLQRGWFAAAGLDVQLLPGAATAGVESLEQGGLDVAVTDPLLLVVRVGAGASLRGFARFLHSNSGLMLLQRASAQRPRDISSLRLWCPPGRGEDGSAIVRAMVEADCGQIQRVSVVDGGGSPTAALVGGDADAAAFAFHNLQRAVARHAGHAIQIFAAKDWGVPDISQLVFAAGPWAIERRHDVLSAFVRVIDRALDVLREHPRDAQDIYVAANAEADDELARATFAATAGSFTFDLAMAPGYYTALAQWAESRGLVAQAPPAEACWTNELALRHRSR